MCYPLVDSTLNPILNLKYSFFGRNLRFIRTRSVKNDGLWRHFGVIMSPENYGVFKFLKMRPYLRLVIPLLRAYAGVWQFILASDLRWEDCGYSCHI